MGAFAGAAQVISDRQHQQHLLDYQQNYLQNQALAAEFGRMAEDPRTLPEFRGIFRQQQINAILETPGKLHKPEVPLANLLKQQEQARIRLNQTDPHNLPGGMVDHGALQGISPPPIQGTGPASDTSSGAAFSTPNQSGTPYQGQSYGGPPPLAPGQAPQPQGPPGANGMMMPPMPPTPDQQAGAAITAQQSSASAPSQVSGMPSPGNGNPLSAGAVLPPPPQVQEPVQPVSSVPNFGMRPPHEVATEAVGPEPPMSDPGTWEESPQHGLWRTLYSKAVQDEMQRQAEMRSKIGIFAYERAENKKFIDEHTAQGGHIKWKMNANGGITGEPDMGTRTPGYVLGSQILSINPDAQAVSGKNKAPLEPYQLYHERTFENGDSEYHPASIRAKFQYEMNPTTHQLETHVYDPVSGREVAPPLAGHPVIPGLVPSTTQRPEFKEVTDPVTGLVHLVMIPVTSTTTKGGITAPPGSTSPASVPPTATPQSTAPSGEITAPPGVPIAATAPSSAIPGLPRGAKDLGLSGSQAKITKAANAKAYASVLDSAERFNIMNQNYIDGVKNNDQQAMLSLLAQHMGMTLGTIKGVRQGQVLIDEAMKSRPWLEGMKAKFDSDGYLTGVTLSPEQMRRMVGLGRERFMEDLKKAKAEAGLMGAKEGSGPPIVPNTATHHFYRSLVGGDIDKARGLEAQDGWSVR